MIKKKPTEKEQTPAFEVKRCFLCKKEGSIYTSLRVYIMRGNEVLFEVFRAQCPFCGHIRIYEIEGKNVPGIYKLNGKVPDFKYQFWPELKKYNLDPEGFINEVYLQFSTFNFDIDNLPKRR